MAKPLLGTKNADDLVGTSAADKILGLGHDDTLTGGQAHDFLNGGPGTDTAVFTGAFADYTLQIRGHGHGLVTVTDTRADGDGTDRLINVERLAFSDVTVDSAGSVVGAAADNVVVVHADGTFDSFTTIALAVDAATDGETVFIGAGSFDAGSIQINEDLTIIGTSDTQINGGFYIGAGGDGASIDNVTINGGAAVAGESGPVGVFVQADNVTITNSTFVGDGNDATADRGIVTSINDATGLAVSGNTFTGWNTGVYLNPGTDAQVTNNAFQGNVVGLSADQDASSDVMVSGNTFTDSSLEQVGFGVMGAGAIENVGVQVFDNSFVGTAPEVSVYLLDANQTVTASAAADTFVYSDNGAAGDAWTINAFDAMTDHIELGAATVSDHEVTATETTLTLSTGDELHLTGVTTFDSGWFV